MTATALHAPDGVPWCHFERGFWCVNGDACLNPNHRRPLAAEDAEGRVAGPTRASAG